MAGAPAALGQGASPQPELNTIGWSVAGVGKDARVLMLAYEGGGCARGQTPAAEVAQRGKRVRVKLTLQSPPPGAPCTADSRRAIVRVRLDQPVNGRRILALRGHAEQATTIGERRGVRLLPVVPKVEGLAPVDARIALGAVGFRVVKVGRRRGVVVSQMPAAGSRLKRFPAAKWPARAEAEITIGRRHARRVGR